MTRIVGTNGNDLLDSLRVDNINIFQYSRKVNIFGLDGDDIIRADFISAF